MQYQTLLLLWIFLNINACKTDTSTQQIQGVYYELAQENNFLQSLGAELTHDLENFYERHFDTHKNFFSIFIDDFQRFTRDFQTQVQTWERDLNFTEPQTFAKSISLASQLQIHQKNTQEKLQKLYTHNAFFLENCVPAVRIYYEKQIQNLIDSAYILTKSPLFNLPKLNYEEMRLSLQLLASESLRIWIQALRICQSLSDPVISQNFDALLVRLLFTRPYWYEKIEIGDTCTTYLGAYHPYKFGTNDYLVFQKDTIRNHTNQTLYNFPTHKVGKQQVFVRFYTENRFWNESSSQNISYEVVK